MIGKPPAWGRRLEYGMEAKRWTKTQKNDAVMLLPTNPQDLTVKKQSFLIPDASAGWLVSLFMLLCVFWIRINMFKHQSHTEVEQ